MTKLMSLSKSCRTMLIRAISRLGWCVAKQQGESAENVAPVAKLAYAPALLGCGNSAVCRSDDIEKRSADQRKASSSELSWRSSRRANGASFVGRTVGACVGW